MMKKLFFTAIMIAAIALTQAQESEHAPVTENPQETSGQNNFSPEDLFDLEFSFDIGTNGVIGSNSQAGVVFFDNQFWISTWNSDVISILDNEGVFVESFAIPGLTGTRALTTDGNVIWAGTAGLQIFELDPVNRVVLSTINITTASSAEARMCTYDETLDGGNGGFWIGNFTSDIAAVDMNGNELAVIPEATHGTTMYGGAVDTISEGGPYLWISNQTPAGEQHLLTQIDIATGLPTGQEYDFLVDAPAGNQSGIAGGLYIAQAGEVSQDPVLVSVCQCQPSNILFGVELSEPLSTGENALSDFSVYPNPVTGNVVTIETKEAGAMKAVVYDITGKRVIDAASANNTLDVSGLVNGVYILEIEQKGAKAQKKLIIK